MTRFSVVIPCRNEGRDLAVCLDAIAAQDMDDVEVIVVDGRSTDGTGALAASRGARVLSDGGAGPAAARNIGIRAARGEVVAFTDADCVPRFDWLAKLDDALRLTPRTAGAAGGIRMTRETLLGRLEDNDARIHYEGYITSNIAYRRDVLLEVGGFDDSLTCAEDYDLAWRVLDAGYRIERAPGAIVLHDPPEVHGRASGYLAKQLWYARRDVPAHVRALQRVWRSHGAAPGSIRAMEGLAEAAQRSAFVALAARGLARPSVALAGAALGIAIASCARDVTGTLGRVGEGSAEAWEMTLVETAKTFARGAGTLVGIADLARPSTIRALLRPAPSRWGEALSEAPPRPSPA